MTPPRTRRAFLGHLLGPALLAGETLATLRSQTLQAATLPSPDASVSPRENGYRGIWFALGQRSEFGDKYSGGLGTYTANHVPMAIYAPEVRRTFFVYGGTREGRRHLLAMAASYDHRRHLVPRPTIVHDKQGVDDPHDNPSLCLDGDGHLWVFVSGRARARPGLIYRSRRPYSTEAFDLVAEKEFTYPQPRWIPGRGLLLMFTRYTHGRELYLAHSPDGRTWSPDRLMAGIGGHYQTTDMSNGTLLTAFNRHPGGSVDRRTDLYYLRSRDGGDTWETVTGTPITLPLTRPDNPARVRDFQTEGQRIYIHDLGLDGRRHPAILFIRSADHRPGPPGDPRWWSLACWNGSDWRFTDLTPANHNYSTGLLDLSRDGRWRIVGPTTAGPQPIGAGGEITAWESRDHGAHWHPTRHLTRRSPRNHNYVRRPLHAHPDFAAFWADGNPDAFSPSDLYFASRSGREVWRLPRSMKSDHAEPERVRLG